MTPKEKALTLIHTFTRATLEYDTGRQCALLAVEEILNMGVMSDSGDWKMAKLYWAEVKHEIEKL